MRLGFERADLARSRSSESGIGANGLIKNFGEAKHRQDGLCCDAGPVPNDAMDPRMVISAAWPRGYSECVKIRKARTSLSLLLGSRRYAAAVHGRTHGTSAGERPLESKRACQQIQGRRKASVEDRLSVGTSIARAADVNQGDHG